MMAMQDIINTTPHPITFKNDDGSEFTVQPCGKVINASVDERVVRTGSGGVQIVRAVFKKGSPRIVAMKHVLKCPGPRPSLDQWKSDGRD
jgi:hypothetical protein